MSDRIPMASTLCTTEEILRDPYVRSLVHEAESTKDDPDVLVRLAAALNARLMHEKAMDACRAGLARNPRHPGLFWEQIRAASYRGKEVLDPILEEALRLRDEAPGAAWAERNLGLVFYFLGKDEPCREACDRALGLDPRDGRAHEVLAYRAYTIGDREKALW